MSDEINWTDRYGGNWPDPDTICKGPCEGLGSYPVRCEEAHPGEGCINTKEFNGWHFVKCNECNGTGRR